MNGYSHRVAMRMNAKTVSSLYANRFLVLSEINYRLYINSVLWNSKEHIRKCRLCQESLYLANKFARIYARESKIKR